ncbi:Na+/H+ antiporter subunit E [Thiohalorhabdus sp.]|uniref:Na+/H+ antiporter subunit E n=1 Tax=Thiohalorhabdus sp. TaxID=3094134 RepID=UPI002FC2F397
MIDRSRWLPHPVFSLVLAVVWVLLNNSIGPGTIVVGLALGLVLPAVTTRFWPGAPAVSRPGAWLRLLGRLLADILVANLAVAALILRPRCRPRTALIDYPLTVRDAVPVTILSSIISLTPGTVTVDVDRRRRQLRIHCLDLADESALVERIHDRYECLLEEIFP